LTVFISTPALAESGKRYFISVPEGARHGWVQELPECREMPESEKSHHKKCTTSLGAVECTTDKTVTLTFVNTKKKKKFPIHDWIYSSLTDCENGRDFWSNPGE
jgi:hypothetical protein